MGEVRPASGVCHPGSRAEVTRDETAEAQLVRLIEARLRRDVYEPAEHAGDYALGWADHAQHTLRWLTPLLGAARINAGLAELAACDVDTLFDHGGES